MFQAMNAVQPQERAPFSRLLSRRVEFGSLVALALPEGGEPSPAALDALHEEERLHAATLPGRRRCEWVGGRLALRQAAAAQGLALGPILVGPRGEPALPEGISASISHKRRLVAALVARGGSGTVGLDLEELHPPRLAIAERVLRSEELAAVEALPAAERWGEVVRRFSVKEAIYKALHPHLRRFVGFDEASVEVRGAGGARALLHLRCGSGPLDVEVALLEEEGHVWSMVRVTPRRQEA